MASKINKNKVIASAQKFVQKGQFDKAIKEYSKIVEEDPRDVRIWLKIGDLYAKKKSKHEAVDTYTKVAEFYSEQGFYLKAVAVYKQILKIDSSLVEINLRLAELYKQLGLLSDAMQQYEQVSNFYHQAGRTKEALAALRQIVDLDPENVASRIKLAELYSKESLREEAIEEFSKAADYLRADNRMDDFIKVAERLVFHQPDNMAVTRELAKIYIQKRDPRRALHKLQLAFKADPRDEETLEMLALAFESLGQIAKTVSVLKELANIHAENGLQDKQYAIFQRIKNLSPTDEDAIRYFRQGAHQTRAPVPPVPSEKPNHPHAGTVSPNQRAYFQDPNDLAREQKYSYAEDVDKQHPEELFNNPPYPDSMAYEPNQVYDGNPVYNQAGDYQQQPYEAPVHLDDVNDTGYEIYDADVSGSRHQDYPADDASFDIIKIVTEADVYVKYGLQDKAIDHLLQVFNHDPNNLEVHLKLKDLYIQIGNYPEAAHVLFNLASRYIDVDRREAARYLNDALELDPDNNEARELLKTLEGPASLDADDQTLDKEEFSYTESIDLDSADIVEEIPIDSSDLLDSAEMLAYDEHYDQPWDAESKDTQAGIEEFGEELEATLARESRDAVGLTDALASEIDGGFDGPSDVDMVQLVDEPVPFAEPAAKGAGPKPKVDRGDQASVEDDLEEADFFIQQNLLSEARAILDEAISRAPNNPLVQAKVEELERLERQSVSDLSQNSNAEEAASDWADELASEFDEIDQLDIGPDNDDNFSMQDVFEEVKRGSEAQTSEEDSDTHYDLGIAYREMGLYDDAINEFKVAMRAREKEVLCHMMIGLCYMEKELISEAISQFKTGLYVEGITERETVALYFELGLAYEHLKDFREALYYYEKVAKKDRQFRDVVQYIARVKELAEAESRMRIDKNDGGKPNSGNNGNDMSKHLG